MEDSERAPDSQGGRGAPSGFGPGPCFPERGKQYGKCKGTARAQRFWRHMNKVSEVLNWRRGNM